MYSKNTQTQFDSHPVLVFEGTGSVLRVKFQSKNGKIVKIKLHIKGVKAKLQNTTVKFCLCSFF